MSSNYVTLRKVGGFYQTFDNDAIIINYLSNYKIVNGRVGFPISSLDKITNILDDNKINYLIKESMDNTIKKDFKTNNKYNKILDKGKKKLDINYRINKITDNLSKLSLDKVTSLLDLIEEYINE